MSKIARERRGITADTAVRLGRYFRTDPRFWLNAQTAHDLSKAFGGDRLFARADQGGMNGRRAAGGRRRLLSRGWICGAAGVD
jgi:plasmid maintenance system antidote protein VapI